MEQLDQNKVYYCRDEIEQDIDNVEHDLDHIQLQLQTYTFSESLYETHEEFNNWKARATFSLSEKAREIRRLERLLRKFDSDNSSQHKESNVKPLVNNSLGNSDTLSKSGGFFDKFSFKAKA